MKQATTCFILFHGTAFGLDEAHKSLREQGLTVARQDNVLLTQWRDSGPLLRISLARGQNIQNEAATLAKGTRYASPLSNYDARFEIVFDDLDEVLDETNTLIEVQLTLQNATKGFLYNTWNKVLSPPDE